MRRRLQVLHVATSTRGAGATLALGYLREQLRRGWQVRVSCPSHGDLGYAAREAGAEVTWWPVAGHHASARPSELRALREIVTTCEPDVVHLHGPVAGRAGRLVVRHRIPTVYQPHGWDFLTTGGRAHPVLLRWERYAARWTTALICAHLAEGEQAERLGIMAPTTVLPEAVDLSAFVPQGPEERRAARLELGLGDTPTVVCVGRLTLDRGQQDLLADWPDIRAQVGQAQLVLVGEGPDRDSLARQAKWLEGVRLVGARVDVDRWLAAADVVVAPSRTRGLALVPLEAMASGRSLVMSEVEGIRESVPADAGAIVPAGDGEALVAAVVRRLRNVQLSDSEGLSGRIHVEDGHDLVVSARVLGSVYLHAVAGRRR